MTTQSNIKTIAEKVKSMAMGFIGSMFIALGFSYFSEQAHYRVPRILTPTYNSLGNKGLAIGLLILGAILLYTSYTKFKNNEGRPAIILTVLPLFIIFSFAITKWTENKSNANAISTGETVGEPAKENKDTIRPKLDHPTANNYLDQVELLVDKMTKTKEQKDDKAFEALETQYFELQKQLTDIIPQLSKTDKYAAFVHYNAYLASKINKMRGIE